MLKKLIGLGLVFGVATTVSAFAGGCSSTTTTVNDVDSGNGGGKEGGGGGGDSSVPGDDGGGGNCPVKVTTMDIAEVNPPKDNTQGSCTDTELGKITGKFSDILAAVSPTCASCLFTEANDMTNTQFFVWADTMHVNVSLENFGACMGSPLSGGNADCGKAGEELFSCLQAACPLTASGAPACCQFPLQETIAAALRGDCKPYDQKQTAACGGAAQLASIKARCFDTMPGYDPALVPGVGPALKLLCGGSPITDAGGG